MKRREEIKSAAAVRAAAIMRTHEKCKEEERGRGWGKECLGCMCVCGGGEGGCRKEASDFSSVTVAFRLTASLPPCQHKKT